MTGTTTDSAGHRIPYVTLWVNGVPRAVSDDSGRFALRVSATQVATVDVRRIGYQREVFQVLPGTDTTVSLVLVPTAQPLRTTEVIGRSEFPTLHIVGFYDRLAEQQKWGGSGQFVTPEEIEARHASRTTQFFDGRISVRTLRVGNCSVTSQCFIPVGPGNCDMSIYLNGLRLTPRGPEKRSAGLIARAAKIAGGEHSAVWVDDVVSPNELAGMEIYQRATSAPPQYQLQNGNCGVILLWTK